MPARSCRRALSRCTYPGGYDRCSAGRGGRHGRRQPRDERPHVALRQMLELSGLWGECLIGSRRCRGAGLLVRFQPRRRRGGGRPARRVRGGAGRHHRLRAPAGPVGRRPGATHPAPERGPAESRSALGPRPGAGLQPTLLRNGVGSNPTAGQIRAPGPQGPHRASEATSDFEVDDAAAFQSGRCRRGARPVQGALVPRGRIGSGELHRKERDASTDLGHPPRDRPGRDGSARTATARPLGSRSVAVSSSSLRSVGGDAMASSSVTAVRPRAAGS